jgi:hypothetical protein
MYVYIYVYIYAYTYIYIHMHICLEVNIHLCNTILLDSFNIVPLLSLKTLTKKNSLNYCFFKVSSWQTIFSWVTHRILKISNPSGRFHTPYTLTWICFDLCLVLLLALKFVLSSNLCYLIQVLLLYHNR